MCKLVPILAKWGELVPKLATMCKIRPKCLRCQHVAVVILQKCPYILFFGTCDLTISLPMWIPPVREREEIFKITRAA
jgi:hypothetical protein